MPAMDSVEILLRLGLATLAGALLGLNRDLHGKPTGVRTLGLVGLASAVVVLAVSHGDQNNVGRVIQGIVTGIGFLGVAVIVRNPDGQQVTGLTTAACVWTTAAMGAACGVADWRVVLIGYAFVFVILHLGGPFEKLVHRFWPRKPDGTH
jgi:putative Mg2+ transporter-C (MgtC) family protein